MASRQPSPFGPLLRRQRRASGLTQEELAERAGPSANTISALEAGRAEALASKTDSLNLTYYNVSIPPFGRQ
jgi:transcriptional regulator with XRE-family HTH domain